MCKHVLNAQVAIRFPCCLRFYDCVDCHEEGKEGGKKRGHAMTRAGTWYLVLVVVLLLLLLSLLLPLSLDHDKGGASWCAVQRRWFSSARPAVLAFARTCCT